MPPVPHSGWRNSYPPSVFRHLHSVLYYKGDCFASLAMAGTREIQKLEEIIMVKRIVAIVFIYICVVAAWMTLGGTVQLRTHTQDAKLKEAVGQLWGTVQYQKAPVFYYETSQNVKVKETITDGERKIVEKTVKKITNHYIPIEASKINVDLHLDQRKKGLLWYSTYQVGFSGRYTVTNKTRETRQMFFSFSLPGSGAVYDNFSFSIDGKEIENIELLAGSISHQLFLQPGQSSIVDITYRSNGMDQWWYAFGDNVTQIKNFTLNMNADFDKIDFPGNSVSPTKKEKTAKGWNLSWTYTNLLSGVQIGMTMPKKLNPGPWTSKVIYFAPVSLFLFFFLLLIFSTLKEIRIHPIHYFFLGCAFFAYHLLLAYLVDHLSIHISFWICSAVSIFLVVSYMRIVVGKKFAFLDIGLSQFVFLVLFSYTFFFEGYTGLSITIMCIVTLFIVMQMTAKLDWDQVFKSGARQDSGNPKYPSARNPIKVEIVEKGAE